MNNWLRYRVFFTVSLVGGMLSAGSVSFAQDSSATAESPTRIVATTSTQCLPGARSIHELTPQVALNDFDGHAQTVGALIYSYSQCLGQSRNRWFAQVAAAHVDERGFNANSVLIGAGLELHPLGRAPQLAVSPVVRIGREDFHPGYGNTLYDAALTVSDVQPLRYQTRRIGDQDLSVASSQFEWVARIEYTSRDFYGPSLIGGGPGDAVTLFGSFGLDQAVGHSNWRWKGSLSYQTLAGPSDGFASLGLAFRIVNPSYTNYDWNFALSGQLGDGGFHGVVFSISRRFGH